MQGRHRAAPGTAFTVAPLAQPSVLRSRHCLPSRSHHDETPMLPGLLHALHGAEGVGLRLCQQALANSQAIVGLRHGPHELPRDVQEHVCRQVEMCVLQVGCDPPRQLIPLVVPLVPLVSKDLHRWSRFLTAGLLGLSMQAYIATSMSIQ